MADERTRQIYERGTDPTRVLAMSDGVFAIILTLLVLEIHLPELGPGQTVRNALREIRPSLTAFLISFVIVAIAWAGHRDLFALIRRTDRGIVWLNFLYLLPLSILPFGAAMLATYERDPIALKIYGIILVATVVTRLAMWLYATKRTHILVAPVDARSRWAGVILVAFPGVAYLVGYLVAEPAPTLTIAIYALVPVLYFVAIWIVHASAPEGSVSEEFT
jgi:TMEM175 potassium channel family protein